MKQSSREALIELLFLALYLDDHLSLAEDEVLTRALDSLGWESVTPRESHVFAAFSSARKAAADHAESEEFIRTRAALIKSEGGAAEAMTWLHKVLAADGLSAGEKRFLGKLELLLYS